MLAMEETRRLGHSIVGTEMSLLGLLDAGGLAERALKAHHIDRDTARVEVEKIIGRGSGLVAVEIPFTPRGKRVLELSWAEAINLGHTYIGTEHILLGILSEAKQSAPENPGIAQMVLQGLKVELNALSAELFMQIKNKKIKSNIGRSSQFHRQP